MTRNILIYRLGSLGDTLVALPCFNAVRLAHAGDRKILLTNMPVSSKAAPLAAILGNNTGFFDEVLAYPVALRNPLALVRLLTQIRRLRVDTVVYMTPGRGTLTALRDWLFFRLAGARQLYGLPIGADRARCRRLSNGTLEPEAVRLARCLENEYEVELDAPASWDLHLTQAELIAGREAVGPFGGSQYIAMNTGGKAAEKDWGLPNWEALTLRLATRLPGTGLLIVGAREDAERAEHLARFWKGRVVNACGKLSPRETGAALRGARLFIGHDSGPLHLAATVGVPCVGLFGDYNEPAMWHPIGKQHRILHEMRGIGRLTVEAVESAAGDLLHGTAKP